MRTREIPEWFPAEIPEEELVTVSQAAERYGMTRQNIHQSIRYGRLHVVKGGTGRHDPAKLWLTEVDLWVAHNQRHRGERPLNEMPGRLTPVSARA